MAIMRIKVPFYMQEISKDQHCTMQSIKCTVLLVDFMQNLTFAAEWRQISCYCYKGLMADYQSFEMLYNTLDDDYKSRNKWSETKGIS